MFFSVILWLTRLILCGAGELSYECGAHGKFEYCVDGAPGCVVGCHCHPGYFFDTDTKICEPNIKLSRGQKWRHTPKPDRNHFTNYRRTNENIRPPTTDNTLKDNVSDKVKDADDLGDWLYNQFFKSIENKIINDTNKDSQHNLHIDQKNNDELFKPKDGRRSGSLKNKPNSAKKLKNKKKSKGRGLRRKLLRISEDDSLFHSSSGSESESDSSDDSSSGSSSSETSRGQESKTDKDERGHGHKKILIYNRRPRPPLPSFIFLPNMDSPYYPPIGLPPPPPVLPMYPMVPIPPMAPLPPMPPIYPPPGGGNGITTTTACVPTTSASSTISTSSATTTAATDTTDDSEDITPNPDSTNNDVRSKKHAKSKIHKSKKPVRKKDIALRSRDPNLSNNLPPELAEQIELIKQLRENLEKKKEARKSSANDYYEPYEGGSPFLQESSEKRQRDSHKDVESNNRKNFKYLSELIHRTNHDEEQVTPTPSNVQSVSDKMPNTKITRKNYDSNHSGLKVKNNMQNNVHPSVLSDKYFANLGKQIASIVRHGDPDVVENYSGMEKMTYNPYGFDDNNFGPRSYWERFVRSPISALFGEQYHDNNLSGLEEEVKIFAHTDDPPSLQDLENKLNKLAVKPLAIKKKQNPTRKHGSNDNFNVNLLPKLLKLDNFKRNFYNRKDYAQYVLKTLKSEDETEQKLPNTSGNIYLPQTDGVMMHSQNIITTVPNTSTIKNIGFEKETKHFNSKSKNKGTDIIINHNSDAFHDKIFQRNKTSIPESTEYSTVMFKDTRDLSTRLLDTPKKYTEMPAKLLEKHENHSIVKIPKHYNSSNPDVLTKELHPLTITKQSRKGSLIPELHLDLVAKVPKQQTKNLDTQYMGLHTIHNNFNTKYPDIQPIKHSEKAAVSRVSSLIEIFAKNTEELQKYVDPNNSNLPLKYFELLAKYGALTVKHPELLANFSRDSVKFLKSLTTYFERLTKKPTSGDNNFGLKYNISKLPVEYLNKSLQYVNIPAKYDEKPTNNARYRNLPPQYRKISGFVSNYTESYKNNANVQAKEFYSEKPKTLTELPIKTNEKYLGRPVKFIDPQRIKPIPVLPEKIIQKDIKVLEPYTQLFPKSNEYSENSKNVSELLAIGLESPRNYVELPINYNDSFALYPQLLPSSAESLWDMQYPEKAPKYYETSSQNFGQIEKYPVLYAEQQNYPVTYPQLITRYSEVPTIYSESSTENHELSSEPTNKTNTIGQHLENSASLINSSKKQSEHPIAKYTETPTNNTDMPLRYSEKPERNLEFLEYFKSLVKYNPVKPEPPINRPESPVTFSKQNTDYSESTKHIGKSKKNFVFTGKYLKMPEHRDTPSTKYIALPNLSAKYSSVLTIYPRMPTEFSEIIVKRPTLLPNYKKPSRYAEVFQKYLEIGENNPEEPARYPLIKKYPTSSALLNYKKFHYFPASSNEDYVLKPYPLQISSDSVKPTLFNDGELLNNYFIT